MTREELLQNLAQFIVTHNRLPIRAELIRRHGLPELHLKRVFGTLGRGVLVAELVRDLMGE